MNKQYSVVICVWFESYVLRKTQDLPCFHWVVGGIIPFRNTPSITLATFYTFRRNVTNNCSTQFAYNVNSNEYSKYRKYVLVLSVEVICIDKKCSTKLRWKPSEDKPTFHKSQTWNNCSAHIICIVDFVFLRFCMKVLHHCNVCRFRNVVGFWLFVCIAGCLVSIFFLSRMIFIVNAMNRGQLCMHYKLQKPTKLPARTCGILDSSAWYTDNRWCQMFPALDCFHTKPP